MGDLSKELIAKIETSQPLSEADITAIKVAGYNAYEIPSLFATIATLRSDNARLLAELDNHKNLVSSMRHQIESIKQVNAEIAAERDAYAARCAGLVEAIKKVEAKGHDRYCYGNIVPGQCDCGYDEIHAAIEADQPACEKAMGEFLRCAERVAELKPGSIPELEKAWHTLKETTGG